MQEVKISSPDYKNMNTDAALSDFLLRIEHYKERYEPLDEAKEAGLSFMKIYNTGFFLRIFVMFADLIFFLLTFQEKKWWCTNMKVTFKVALCII